MTADALDLLDLLEQVSNGPESWRIAERDRVIAAMSVAFEADGCINPNRVRSLLTNPTTGELDVNPRVLSATYSSRRQRGVIRHVGWTTSTDAHGGNAGKPARTYAFTQEPQ